MKMETCGYVKRPVTSYQITHHHISEHSNLHYHLLGISVKGKAVPVLNYLSTTP
jgi:hypothetical protein